MPSTQQKTIYQEEGFANRREYLDSLADEYGLDKSEVYMMASMLGSSEDFDGLVSHCEDAACAH